MEYRSLFDTDTESLLNEINTLEQQQNKPVYNVQNMNGQQTMSSYSSQSHQLSTAHMPSYQTQNLLPGQQIMPTSQQQQQHMTSAYMMTPTQSQQYYSPNNSNMMVTQTLKNSINTGYMQNTMAPPPPPQTVPSNMTVPPQPQTQQQPPPPLQQPSQTAPTNGTTIQNVQINVQNNYNIAKQMPSTTPNNPSTNSAVIQPNQMQAQSWGMNNSQYQPVHANTMSSTAQMQYKNQVINNMQPTPMQQQQQQIQSQPLIKLNQFNTSNQSIPMQTPAQQNFLNNNNNNQQYQTMNKTPNPVLSNNYSPSPQQSHIQTMTPSTVSPQMTVPHSNYSLQNYNNQAVNVLPQPINVQKLSAIPPHMQAQQYSTTQPINQQMYANNTTQALSTSVTNQQIQNRPVLVNNNQQPNQIQAYHQSPNKNQNNNIAMQQIQTNPLNYQNTNNNMLGVNVNQGINNQSQLSPTRSVSQQQQQQQQPPYYQPQTSQQMPQTNIYSQYQQPNQYVQQQQQPFTTYNSPQTNPNQSFTVTAPNMINSSNRMSFTASNPTPINTSQQQMPSSYSINTTVIDSNETTNSPTKGKGKGKNKASKSGGLSSDSEQTEPKTKGKRGNQKPKVKEDPVKILKRVKKFSKLKFPFKYNRQHISSLLT